MQDLSIYVHIPFCKAKCKYCDFLSFGGCSQTEQKEYVEALCFEIKAYEKLAKDYKVRTIFFGGGTPSFIDPVQLCTILETIRDVFAVAEDAEITIEGNPDSLTREALHQYRKAGMNRVSIGLQSTNDTMLARIGRVHSYEQFLKAYEHARMEGFTNINVDLMSGLPGETMDSYQDTLTKVLALDPEHISAYSLIVEEGTPLLEDTALLAQIPEEEEDRNMYALTKQLLAEHGYERYEISNYAKPGYSCRHNKVYWTGGEYLGVGLGAASYLRLETTPGQMEAIRFHGVEAMREYIGRFLHCDGMREDEYTDLYHFYEEEDPFLSMYGYEEPADTENLSRYKSLEQNATLEFLRDYYKDLYFCKRKDEMEEFMFLGLRLMEGVSKTEFHDRFGVSIEHVYGKVIQKYKEQNLLVQCDDRIFLSDAGIDVSNVIMAEFML